MFMRSLALPLLIALLWPTAPPYAAEPSPEEACLASRLGALFPTSPGVHSEFQRLPTQDGSAVATALMLSLERAQGELLYLGISGPTPPSLAAGIAEARALLDAEAPTLEQATAWSDLTLVYFAPTTDVPALEAVARQHALALRVEPWGDCTQPTLATACAPSLAPVARHHPLIMPRQCIGLRTPRGLVLVRYVVEPSGHVSTPVVHWSTSSLFDRVAVDYVQGFEYAPRASACQGEVLIHAHYAE
ncbi:MAG: hypothetical protein AAFX85_07715 [Pseudomonadota bacterium]